MSSPEIGLTIQSFVQQHGLVISIDDWYFGLALTLTTLLVGWLMLKLVQMVLTPKFTSIIFGTKADWNDELHKRRFFKRLSHIASATTLNLAGPLFLPEEHIGLLIILKLSLIYLIITTVWAIFAIFNGVQEMYDRSKYASRVPINGFIQVSKLLLSVIAILLVVSQLLGKSPTLLLSGLGAITAIVILVFRDTILGFVSGINIVANRTVTNGDWIEMPNYNADGTVMQVGLTTVKVRNWDNTISTIPTYALMSDSIKNWRGMEQSGGRRIKRAIHIDVHTIRFCDAQLLAEVSQIALIKDYVHEFQQNISTKEQQIAPLQAANLQQFTNIGLYRKYLESYLKQHPQINDKLTLLVRQLSPSATGVPIEIYCFSKDKAWVNYEGIQSDIFDHAIAVLPMFGLSPYQFTSVTPDKAMS